MSDASDDPSDQHAQATEFRNRVNGLRDVRRLRELVLTLAHVVRDLHCFARRYADGRRSVAAGLVNDHTTRLLELGVGLLPGAEGTLWAEDGMGRDFDHLTDEQLTPGTQAATGWYIPLPRNFSLADALTAALGSRDPARALQSLLALALENCRLAEAAGGEPAATALATLAAAGADVAALRAAGWSPSPAAAGLTSGDTPGSG